ncbi:MAG TPA: HAD-IIA family hydrolase [Cryptosporangiaceae bacterium]|nr:HAD-IIA family hydrolase [Cryptosporangiaceae bacterium]
MADRAGLQASDEPLTARYDTALLDLDGVVYLQEEPIPFAADGVAAARAAGMRIGFVTNNASRRPAAIASLLAGLGVPAAVDEVVTSAQAAATLLAERLPAGAPVLVVGSAALAEEIAEVGLAPVHTAVEAPLAVVQGYGPEVGWALLAEACVAVRAGALWVATNGDTTFPSVRGPLPGNGAMVAALATALGRPPDEIVGKPHPRLHEESVRRTGARRPLVVGDRLDTDIAGAHAGGSDSLLVLTGVATAAAVLAAPPDARPTYLAEDLRGLVTPHPAVPIQPGTGTRCGGWSATTEQGALVLAGAGNRIDALRALAVAAWSGGSLGEPPKVRPDGPAAAVVLTALGL